MNHSRRRFLVSAAGYGAGLWLGIPPAWGLDSVRREPEPAALNPFVFIGTDGVTRVFIPSTEIGQGVSTSLAAIVAEELDADWTRVQPEPAPWVPAFKNPSNGIQGTGDSRSVRGWFTHLRTLGATGRWMLIQAAADRWRIPAGSCDAKNGRVTGPQKREADYGQLSAAAARLSPPATVPLKAQRSFGLLGGDFHRKDIPDKVTGQALFGIDVQLPDLLMAAVAHPPEFEARVDSVDGALAATYPGVHRICAFQSTVAVVARTWWQAKQALDKVTIRYESGRHARLDNRSERAALLGATAGAGRVRWRRGDSAGAIEHSARVVELLYDVPYLAHATMEPMNATARVTDELCEVWAPTQSQDRVGEVCRQLTGLPAERIRVHTMPAGGAFGRRSVPDFVIEAVTLARDLGRPIKVIWSREEDMRHDRYRPMAAMRFRAGLDVDGRLEGLQAHLAAPKISASLIADFPDYYTPWPSAELSVDAVPGVSDMPYAVPHLTVEESEVAPTVPLGYWRSVDYSHNGFFIESFIDETAREAGVDPYEYRLELLRDQPRLRAVLDRVIDESGWKRKIAGRYRGLAVLAAYGSFVATVVDLSIAGDVPRVHEIHCAVDCGVIIDRRNLEAQIQGAVGFGLTAALSGEIDVVRGRVVQSNFHDYRVLRMPEFPSISVYLTDSAAAPGGAGELGVPTVAPALTSAWAAATGKRCRSLPLLKV